MPSRQFQNGSHNPINSVFPQRHFKHIKTMKITAFLTPFFMVFSIFSIVVSISELSSRKYLPSLIFFALGVLNFCVLLVIHYYYKQNSVQGLYMFQSGSLSLEEIASHFGIIEKQDKHYAYTSLSLGGVIYLISIYDVLILDAKSLKKKQLPENKRETVHSPSPIRSSHKYARIDIIICDSIDETYYSKLAKTARHLLDRNESIFYTIISNQTNSIYVPELFDDMDYLQVKKYRQFCIIMDQLFTGRSVNTGNSG